MPILIAFFVRSGFRPTDIERTRMSRSPSQMSVKSRKAAAAKKVQIELERSLFSTNGVRMTRSPTVVTGLVPASPTTSNLESEGSPCKKNGRAARLCGASRSSPLVPRALNGEFHRRIARFWGWARYSAAIVVICLPIQLTGSGPRLYSPALRICPNLRTPTWVL